MQPESRPLVLASQSPYRQELLSRLGLPFTTARHKLDPEVPDPTLPPFSQVEALARDKALSLRDDVPSDALVIGSDQGLVFGRSLLGKPGTAEAARAQLAALAGGSHDLVTAVTVFEPATHRYLSATEVHRMTFRRLDAAEIANYVARDEPLDCAGSFRIEALGIALFERIEGGDPTAIMGLPLMRLCELLGAFGVSPLRVALALG